MSSMSSKGFKVKDFEKERIKNIFLFNAKEPLPILGNILVIVISMKICSKLYGNSGKKNLIIRRISLSLRVYTNWRVKEYKVIDACIVLSVAGSTHRRTKQVMQSPGLMANHSLHQAKAPTAKGRN